LIALAPLPGDLLSPATVAVVSRGLTAVVGLFVAGLAYRGYQRNDASKMRTLAVGIGLLTGGVFIVATGVDRAGGSPGVVLVARGVVTVLGLSAVLYALAFE